MSTPTPTSHPAPTRKTFGEFYDELDPTWMPNAVKSFAMSDPETNAVFLNTLAKNLPTETAARAHGVALRDAIEFDVQRSNADPFNILISLLAASLQDGPTVMGTFVPTK